MDVRRLVVAADDRTGALETAGSIADAGLTAVMVPWPSGLDAAGLVGHLDAHLAGVAVDAIVVDLASRHASSALAESRTCSTLAIPSGRSAHKIDSTLRGNWAHELGALVVAGRRVLLIPAFPAAGRTCVGRIVLEHGVFVTERHAGGDIRAPVRSSRPADHLRLAGVGSVASIVSLGDAQEAKRWLGADTGPSVGICDAATDADLRRLCDVWNDAGPDVILAGTAAAIGTGAAALCGEVAPRREPVRLALPLLVVAGSAHPIVRAQTDALIAGGASEHLVHLVHVPGSVLTGPPSAVVVLRPPAPKGPVTEERALGMAAALGVHAHAWLANHSFATLLIVGGDTAAEVLGDAAMIVGGTVAPGMPWCRVLAGGHPTGPLVVTKPGGFGGVDALVALVDGR